MNTCRIVRSSRPVGLFSFGLLDGPSRTPRRPYLREAPDGFGLEHLATALMNSPGSRGRIAWAGTVISFHTFE